MSVHPLPSPLTPVGYITTGGHDTVGLASQASHAPDAIAKITVRPDLVDGLLGLDRYPYIWLLTWLHRPGSTDDPPLRLVPRATEAAGQVQGVFASRAPRRPNPIGLSLVRHLRTQAEVITIAGVDLVDGTPVLDIKPWFADCDDPTSFA